MNLRMLETDFDWPVLARPQTQLREIESILNTWIMDKWMTQIQISTIEWWKKTNFSIFKEF